MVGKFNDIACSIMSCLVMGNCVPKNKKQHSYKVLPLDARGSGNYASLCITSILPINISICQSITTSFVCNPLTSICLFNKKHLLHKDSTSPPQFLEDILISNCEQIVHGERGSNRYRQIDHYHSIFLY